VEQFKAVLKTFILECCRQLTSESPQVRIWTRIVREDGGQTSLPQEMRPDFSRSLFRFQVDTLESKISAFNPVVKIVQEDPKLRGIFLVDAGGKPITEEKSEVWWLKNMLGGRLLHAYTDKAKGFQFNEQTFDQLFDELYRDIESPDIVVTELSPLVGIGIESDQIQIDSNMQLRQLSTDELEEWLNTETLVPLQPLPIPELLGLQCAVEVVYQKKRYSAFGSKDARERVIQLITAMRLLTDESPRLAFTKTRTSSLLTPGFGTSWGPLVLRFGPSAMVNKAQELALVALYRKLGSGPNINKIGLAVTRWNSAADRLTEEDRLIDYWVALESLFVPDTTQELRYRTALRIAAFLGENGLERKQIYEQMKESYDLRSEIVHGRIKKGKKKFAPRELIKLSRSYLREALLKILESSHHFEPSKLEAQLLEKE